MNPTATSRLTAFLTAAVAAAGIFAAALISSSHPSQSYDLADYGSSITAQIDMAHAQHEGVQHQHNGGQQ